MNAREALTEIFGWVSDPTMRDDDGNPVAPADWLINALLLRGYKIVPLLPPDA